jgi:hypothetical protein
VLVETVHKVEALAVVDKEAEALVVVDNEAEALVAKDKEAEALAVLKELVHHLEKVLVVQSLRVKFQVHVAKKV